MVTGDTPGTHGGQRALVAVSPAGQPTLRRILRRCDTDFVTSYPEAAVALTRQRYSMVIVGMHFGESRMFDFIQLVRELEPSARVVAVTGSGTRLKDGAMAAVQTALRELSVEGLFDLTQPPSPAGDLQSAAHVARQALDPVR